ncbi:nuclear factor NF-kappa-B p110 subunit [Musca domestica]|uniref:Nuclear factor NF-kappa-B p110 subunit n=1 Tax=Musca domestica TaxID=7370 RepID=A0A1I8MHC1_MUSDO|nr:nuclear factor NF-kappa-B p110 subunit [Musca domestica]
MLPHYFGSKDIVDMDTNERIRYMSESSMSGTSGYSTNASPARSQGSLGNSPAHSPSTILQTELSNLTFSNSYQHLSPSPPSSSPPQLLQQQQQYVQLQNVPLNQAGYGNYNNNSNMSGNYILDDVMGTIPNTTNFQQQQPQSAQLSSSYMPVKRDYPATLRILEQPVEKFRFRYKSEMHGTHGSLNGANSQRTTKSFPEIELCDYKEPAIIRCSLFQANRDSPHSHQLVVRKDDHDICDPHELKVSQQTGFFVEFKNMGIIHTAKKFIVEELLKKKRKRLQFELGRDNLTTKEQQELSIQTEKEAKDMNLNQVRLCFEAFGYDQNNKCIPIAAPVYSNTINNRKSAQTGELKITRLSIATGSVTGGEDLILLVEKVNKKNIKVRFFEMNEDDLVWEAYASFRESDVHHQYAIVCRTPPYENKDIDKPVEVFIQLVRPTDDERSEPPVLFRYKPRDAVTSRKRRRICSSMSGGDSSSSSGNSGSLSSGEIPRTIQEQQQSGNFYKFLSEEIERLVNDENMRKKYLEGTGYSDDLLKMLAVDDNSVIGGVGGGGLGKTEKDGAATNSSERSKSLLHYKKLMISKKLMDTAKEKQQQDQQKHNNSIPVNNSAQSYMQQIVKIFVSSKGSAFTDTERRQAAEDISKLYNDYSDLNAGESLLHEMVVNDNSKFAIQLCHILKCFQLQNLLNSVVNNNNQTVLHTACLYNRPHYIRPLLNLGCNPNLQDKKGDTAMHIAVREKHTSCLETFLKTNNELKLNLRNDDGFTLLHLAVRDNNYEIASKLIQHDDSLSLVSSSIDGNNALHIVVQQQNLELVKLMLENHSMGEYLLHACNTAGHTPLDLARQLATSNKQAAEILSLLQSRCPTTKPAATANTTVVMPFSDMEDSCSNLVIKEEEPSSHSSTDNDDEDEESNSASLHQSMPMVTLPTISPDDESAMDVQIKVEQPEENDAGENVVGQFSSSDLKEALENPNTFSQLCKALKANDLWKKKLPIPHFYLNQADFMLNYVKRNIESIDVQLFAQTLQEIDPNILGLIKK